MNAEPQPFGFRVRAVEPWRFEPEDVPDDWWSVSLPHQCDAWDITGSPWEGKPHAEAVADLERFIAEAQLALEALRERREAEA